jgi:hypothetical protein
MPLCRGWHRSRPLSSSCSAAGFLFSFQKTECANLARFRFLLAAYGFWAATAGRPLLSDELAETG